MKATMLLAGDIGGTKTNLMVFSLDEKPEPEVETTFKSGDYPSLEAIVQEFLASHGLNIDRAIFGVAGPVVDGEAKITNLPWHMSEVSLSEALNLPPEAVKLLNDLEAIAYSVPHLASNDLALLNAGQVTHMPDSHKAVVVNPQAKHE